jgi:Leucine-rich repeat (LRR) protein
MTPGQMLDLHPLELMPKLEALNVSHNLLSNLTDVINILSLMQNLKNLNLRNNPISTTLR